MHQRPAEEQSQHRALKAQGGSQLHNERLRRIGGILLLRQQARSSARPY